MHSLETSDYQDADTRENQCIDLSIDLHNIRVFGRDQDGRCQASSYGQLRVPVSRWNIIIGNIWNIGLSLIQCKEQNRHYFQRECFYNGRFFEWDFDWRHEARSYGTNED